MSALRMAASDADLSSGPLCDDAQTSAPFSNCGRRLRPTPDGGIGAGDEVVERDVSSRLFAAATNVATTAAAGANVAAACLAGSPIPASKRTLSGPAKFRGVFQQNHDITASPGPSQFADLPTHQAGNFAQRLDILLSTEANAKAIARKLYQRFNGDMGELSSIVELMEVQWEFPDRVLPLLFTQLRRTTGQADDPLFVGEEQWCDAFFRWLLTVRTRCGQSKISRKQLIKERSGLDLSAEYLQGAKLGEGSYGEVHLMLHKSLGVARVVKSVAKSQLGMAEEFVEDEVKMLKSLDHPHIVRIFETFETEDQLHIVMDYAQGGDLSTVMADAKGRDELLPEWWVRIAVGQMAAALEMMHLKAVIHCDLKPANVMLVEPIELANNTEPHILLADLGLAEIFEERSTPGKMKGTPLYMPPEGFQGRVSTKNDMWALGVMTFEMLAGRWPFGAKNGRRGSNAFAVYTSLMQTEIPIEEVPPGAQEIVQGLLAKDAESRLTASQCRLHAWFVVSGAKVSTVGADARPPKFLGQTSYFRHATMFCIASGLSVKESHDLLHVFQSMDKDQSGGLTVGELAEGLAILGIKQDAARLMTVLDLDGDGVVSYTEFLAGAMQIEEHTSDRLMRYAFDVFDLDGDGCISMSELQFLLSGEGPLVDVLPDGQTVEQVMEKASGGHHCISYEQFQSYLRASNDCPAPAAVRESSDDEDHLLCLGSLEERTCKLGRKSFELTPPFPQFAPWYESLYEGTQNDAAIGGLLVFTDPLLERAYVTQSLPHTCQQVMVISSVMCAYAFGSLFFSDFRWDPTVDTWDTGVLFAYNASWMIMLFTWAVVLIICAVLLRARRSDDECSGDADQTKAIHFERLFCSYSCVVPWFACFFLNRTRVAALFGRSASTVFSSVNSDYDLVIVMLGTLAFFSTRTHIRLIWTVPLAVSCVFAYIISSLLLGTGVSCEENEVHNWVWPALILLLLSILVLSGHRAIEHQRRLTFFSLYASYEALRELHEYDSDAHAFSLSITPDSENTTSSRISCFNRAYNVLQRLNTASEIGVQPGRPALNSLLTLLQGLRSDIIEFERNGVLNVHAVVKQRGLVGDSRNRLLAFFESPLPACADTTSASGTPRFQLDFGPGMTLEPWGWDTLSGVMQPLAQACQALLWPALEALVPDSATQARRFQDLLAQAYMGTPQSAEARVALALRAAHWLAQCLGLWQGLDSSERVALLVASAGLHCADRCESGGGWGMFAEDPMLIHVACSSKILAALEGAGFVVGDVRRLVCRFIMRARPHCMLHDVSHVKTQISKDEHLLKIQSSRIVLAGLVVGAGNFAFLALSSAYHQPWALLCRTELAESMAHVSSQPKLDVASWFQEIIETLVLPVFEVFNALDATKVHLDKPIANLRGTVKHWKLTRLEACLATKHPLSAATPVEPDLPGQVLLSTLR